MKNLNRRRQNRRRHRPFRMESLEDRKMMTITVDTVLDVIAPDGVTSLREAIVTANSTLRNEIDFDSSLSGQTIELNSQLFISDTLTIDASSLGEKIVIDAQNNSRVFDFSANNGDFTLRGVTVTNGEIADVGGGIRFDSNGELTIVNSLIHNNATTGNGNPGGGIYTNGGNISLIRSTVSDNSTSGNDSDGGGIRTWSGNVTATRSTISGNGTTGDSSDGGGIRTRGGSITLTRSTVNDNSTSGDDSHGGGVQSSVGTISIDNSTISGNHLSSPHSAGGGIHTVGGSVIVEHGTITGNSTFSTRIAGAGIAMDPNNSSANESLSLSNSIVAGNYSRNIGADFLAPAGGSSQLVVTNSLVGDNSATTLIESQTADARGNLIGSSVAPIDARLGPLEDHGGVTATHRPMFGSPAIDAGDPLMLANPTVTDQRGPGFERVVNERVDMGAFEVDHITVNDNSSDSDDGDPNNGVTTLREAVNLANASDDHTLISFDASLSGQTIGLVDMLDITETTTIDASDLESNPILDAQGVSRVIEVDTLESSLTIAGLTLTGGATGGDGGAIRFDSNGTLTVQDSAITGNLALGDGGGIYSDGLLDMRRSTVSDNTSHGSGGGLATRGHIQDITDSTVAANIAYLDGGGIFSQYGRQNINRTTISNNTSNANGGGLYGDSTIRYIESSTISGNTADLNGGGIYGNFLTYLDFTTVTQNTAGGLGGGFFKTGPTTQLTSTIVSDNHADGTPDNLHGTLAADNTNLVGDSFDYQGTLVAGINDPMLGPLADNGGFTFTHALLPGSPAIDTGSTTFTSGSPVVPDYDQRGESFDRVVGTSIDIGAFELQSTPTTCDFNGDAVCDGTDIDELVADIASLNNTLLYDLTGNGVVDLGDRDAWLATAGALHLPSGNAYLLGDANLDGAVDVSDLNIWNLNKFSNSNAWTLADFDASGFVDVSDLNTWNAHKFQSADARGAAAFTAGKTPDEEEPQTNSVVDRVFANFELSFYSNCSKDQAKAINLQQ